MTASDSRLGYLYNQYVNKSCTYEELQEFFGYVRDPANNLAIEQLADEHLETVRSDARMPSIDWEHMFQLVIQVAKPQNEVTDPILHKKNWVTTMPTWSRIAAAAAIIIVFGGSYLLFARRKHTIRENSNSISKIDINAGYSKAILTLSDGSKIELDSANAGKVVQQGNATIINSVHGQLAYHLSAQKSTVSIYNTLTTPRGGQYQIALPDGTKVWLNAASSLVYPTDFSGDDRTVEMTGEAYFEVAHDQKRPFKVKAGSQVIEDIGTHFNVNTYVDESSQVTTLLEGAVRVGGYKLKPGQKASVTAVGKVSVSKGDPEQAVAWKNGVFDFSDADLPTVMRQLGRWYSVDIKYEGKIPESQFNGMIGRSLTLGQVLKGLAREEIHYRIEEGNHLIITP